MGRLRPRVDALAGRLQERLRAAVGKPKREFVSPELDPALVATVKGMVWDRLGEAFAVREKHSRSAAIRAIRTEVKETLTAEGADYADREKEVGAAYRRVFGRHFPAMSVVVVKDLIEDEALIEIEATAYL